MNSHRKKGKTMVTREASCSCGQFRLTAQGEPVRVSVCHCLACQRRTGSAFGVQARFANAKVVIQGQGRRYQRLGDSGQAIAFFFCGQCGATLYFQSPQEPELIAVPVGAFADPAFAAPAMSVYEQRRHPWCELHGDMAHYP